MSLSELRDHPRQNEFYTGDCSLADDAALARDLRDNGQRDAIVVMPSENAAGLPGGTILDGHRRRRLMLANGDTETAVVVRHDLKDADASTVDREFLRFNLVRRHLHPIDRARIAKRLVELERGRRTGSFDRRQQGEIREVVGAALGLSGRHVDRYVRVLETPTPIQNAVRDGRLKLVLGARIATLPEATQREIADRVVAIGGAKEIAVIIAEYLTVADGRRHARTADALASFAKALEQGVSDLADRADRVAPGAARRYAAVLESADRLISILLRRGREVGNFTIITDMVSGDIGDGVSVFEDTGVQSAAGELDRTAADGYDRVCK